MPATAKRLDGISGIGLDRVALAAGNDPDILRLENLDTDVAVPQLAVAETVRATADDDSNSWLPLTGRSELREAVSARLRSQCGHDYDPSREVVITCGGMEGLFNSLLALVDPGSEVVVTDPTYCGMINRVRMVGATPAFVPFRRHRGAWRLDLERLEAAASPSCRAVFIMNPSMPSGAVLNADEWQAIADFCQRNDCWLIYNAAMENILYDGRALIHPASIPGMAERTITVGSASKEYRMIGWKVGWVVGPHAALDAIAKAHIYNTADAVGIAQMPVARLMSGDPARSGLADAIAQWQARRDVIVDELRGIDPGSGTVLVPAAGGWSMLLDVGQFGLTSLEASQRLLERGRVAATYMRDWGSENADQFVRLVFSNEPVDRLAGIGDRVRQSLVN
ncbi:MAG: pyridoxal phosphate-dependent aminotransferase [Nitratireductor sp.]